MLIFKCPTCDDSPMGFNEAEDTWVCSEEECQHVIEADDADEMFDAGDLIAFIDEGEKPDFGKKKDDDDDDEKSGSDDDDDDDEKDESFNGFTNKDTWTVNLIVQNEYKIHKGAMAAVREAEEDDAPDVLQKFVEKKVAKNDDYSDILENVDFEDVDWSEIVEAIVEATKEFDEVRADLESALGVNEDTTEEDKQGIITVFESALMVKYNELKANLEEKFDTDLEEATTEVTERLTKEMSGYLDDVIAEWMKENELAIEQGIQTEMTQNFLEGLADLYKNHWIEVPEDRFDVLEDMSDKIEQLDTDLSEARGREADLQEQVDNANKTAIIAKLSEGLTDTQVEKLDELAGSIDYESEESFEKTLNTLKESFLKTPKNRKDGDVVTTEEKLNEDDDDEKEVDLNDPIARAAHGLSRKN